MMMPANFSAIAETEMTYVVGGGLENYLAPVMTAANWQTYNTNLITIIGNTYMSDFLGDTLGKLFDGSYKPGNVFNALWGNVEGAYGTGSKAGYQTEKYEGLDKFLAGANGVLNGALEITKNLAVVYTLGHGNARANHVYSIVKF